MRFSPIVSIRAGVMGEGYGKIARLDGKESKGREQTHAARSSFSGDDLFCDDFSVSNPVPQARPEVRNESCR
jgi:hypothetical protein